LLKSATVQFKESETDITQFVQSLNAAREIRRGYIEAVYAYNISALELELYSR
jgi:cobalt-zinc-cadmium resistance protein CzcA